LTSRFGSDTKHETLIVSYRNWDNEPLNIFKRQSATSAFRCMPADPSVERGRVSTRPVSPERDPALIGIAREATRARRRFARLLPILFLAMAHRAVFAEGDPVLTHLRDAAKAQQGVERQAVKTLGELEDLAGELAHNRLHDNPLNKQVRHMKRVLERTDKEYLSAAASELQALLYGKRQGWEAKIETVANLQGLALQMLESLRNDKLGATSLRVQHKFQMALEDQEKALAETKRLVFDRAVAVPIGSPPATLNAKQREYLANARNTQRLAEESLRGAVSDLQKASTLRARDDPETARKFDGWLAFLAERKTAETSRQTAIEILSNLVTRALRSGQSVATDLKELIGRMEGREEGAPEGFRKADYAQLKAELEVLLERQRQLNGDVGALIKNPRNVSSEAKMLEARQRQVLDDTAPMRLKLFDVPLAKSTVAQACSWMRSAETCLGKDYPGDAIVHMQRAEQALAAAVLALANVSITGQEFQEINALQIKHEMETLDRLISGVSGLINEQQSLRDKTAAALSQGNRGVAAVKGCGSDQQNLQRQAVELKDSKKTTFELSEATIKVVRLAEQTLGVAAKHMGQAASALTDGRGEPAVQEQEKALREMKEILKLLTSMHQVIMGMAKGSQMRAAASILTKVAALQADMLTQIEEGASLHDVRDVQEEMVKGLAEMMALEGAKLAEAGKLIGESTKKAVKSLEEGQFPLQVALSSEGVSGAMDAGAQRLMSAAAASSSGQAAQLMIIASNQMSLAEQLKKIETPDQLPQWVDMEQKVQDALVEMMDAAPLTGGAAAPASSAAKAIEKALEGADKVMAKAKELINPPADKAKAELLAAMKETLAAISGIQMGANESFEAAVAQKVQVDALGASVAAAGSKAYEEQSTADTKPDGKESGPGMPANSQGKAAKSAAAGSSSGKPSPGGSGGGSGNRQGSQQDGGTSDGGAAPDDKGWDVEFGKRKRLELEQKMERTLPAEYRCMVAGYFRRLAMEGSGRDREDGGRKPQQKSTEAGDPPVKDKGQEAK
jgi:hypothetical protein